MWKIVKGKSDVGHKKNIWEKRRSWGANTIRGYGKVGNHVYMALELLRN